MFSRPNVLFNEINALGLKEIVDDAYNGALHKPEYNATISILHEKKLDQMTPNQVINKIIAHGLQISIKNSSLPHQTSRVWPPQASTRARTSQGSKNQAQVKKKRAVMMKKKLQVAQSRMSAQEKLGSRRLYTMCEHFGRWDT